MNHEGEGTLLIWIVAIIILFCASLLIYYMYKNAFQDMLREIDIYDERFPNTEKFRLFFISDVHKRLISEQTIQQIKNVQLVIIGGDLLEKGVPFERVRENIHILKQLQAPIFFVWGNNDYEVATDELMMVLSDCGVTILKDTTANLELPNDKTLCIIGLDYHLENENKNIERVFERANGDYNILALHDPKMFSLLNEEQQQLVNLVVSGHTHGGQIRLLRWGLYPKGSFTKIGHTYFLVSEGYGTTALPLRLGTNAECHVITISTKT